MSRLFEKVAIAGVGLIGGSLALAVRAKGLVGEVVGFGRTESNLRTARERGIIDSYSLDPTAAARGVDLLFLSVPVGSMAAVASTCAALLKPGAVVTDAGSVKGAVVRDVEAALPKGIAFVGGHPIAGSEQAGAAAARADLFEGRPCILTPNARTSSAALARIRALWEGVGMTVVEMDVNAHDALLARVSHLPHVIAFAMVDALSKRGDEVAKLSAKSVRGMTRIAGSPADVWSDIFVSNRAEVKAALDEFTTALDELRRAVESGDAAALRALIERARGAQARMFK